MIQLIPNKFKEMKKILIFLAFVPFIVNGQNFTKKDTVPKGKIMTKYYFDTHSANPDTVNKIATKYDLVITDSFHISRRGVTFDSIVGIKLDRSETWYFNDTIRDTLVIHVDTSVIGGSANITFYVDSTYIPTVNILSRDLAPVTITQDANSDDYDGTKTHRNELFIYRNGDRIYWLWKNRN